MARLVALIIAIFLLMPSPALAYNVLPQRFEGKCLTHDGSPELVEGLRKVAEVSGIRDCGFSLHPDLSYGLAPDNLVAFWHEHNVAGNIDSPAPTRPGLRDTCRVLMRPDFAGDKHLILHELLHCLGLDHADPGVDAVMNGTGWGPRPTELQPDDIAGLVALYGPPASSYRIYFPL